jgi:hypothetical protein
MFRESANDYIYPPKVIDKPVGNNLYFPVEIDTEYTHPTYDLNRPTHEICTNITVQCRAVDHTQGIIYSHPDIALHARHKTFKHGFVAVDYLEDYGHTVALTRLPSWETSIDASWLQFDVYSFFAVAELLRVFQGVYRTDVLSLVTNPTVYGIEQGRRLRTYTKAGNQLFNWVEMPWLLKLDAVDYRIRLAIYDTCAVHGIANYASFCNNSGIKLEYKDNFTSVEKSIMKDMYNQRPEDFDNYALGDLYNHKALLGNAENFSKIYQALGLTNYFTPPRLTIGATVSRIVESGIKNLFDADANDREVINAFCKYGSADWLKRKSTTTACLNAKVDGGRCRNNRPTDTVTKGIICDIDISGCYGEGLRVQTYPLGVPVIIDYPIKSELNNYDTLKDFLKRYSSELVPGLWQARVSVKQGKSLKYKQDYLASWFPPKDLSKLPTDSAFAETDQWWTVDNVGEIKILTNEVNHAVITHDFVQWLDNVASPRQRKELLEKLVVETAMFYPASERVESVDLLLESHENHKGKNTTRAVNGKGYTRKIAIEVECHKWYGINLGKLLVDKLLLERKKYPKKTPFNDLYKLCINTVYGDMVSPFFTVGNVVVGNNITARARALAWCMEKGLHGWQSITDGCAFDLNRVLYPRDERSISGEYSVNLYADDKLKQHTFAPLVDKDDLSVTLNSVGYELRVVPVETDDGLVDKAALNLHFEDSVKGLSIDDSMKLVNRVAMQHLQRLFPNLDILHQVTHDVKGNERVGQFEFEAKGLFDCATFHGTANYSLSFNGKHSYAMRSYSKRGHKMVVLADELQVINKGDKPSENFLHALKTPRRVERSNVYLKERVLKVGDFRRNYRVWQDSNVYPGCTVEMPGLLHEFSLSQFTFQTYEQLVSWRKEFERLLSKYGQSYEMFFINDDGTLNYQDMIETVDAAIRAGKRNFFDGLDKRVTHSYRQYLKHQQLDCLTKVRSQLGVRYHGQLMLTDNTLQDWGDASMPDYSDD